MHTNYMDLLNSTLILMLYSVLIYYVIVVYMSLLYRLLYILYHCCIYVIVVSLVVYIVIVVSGAYEGRRPELRESKERTSAVYQNINRAAGRVPKLPNMEVF